MQVLSFTKRAIEYENYLVVSLSIGIGNLIGYGDSVALIN